MSLDPSWKGLQSHTLKSIMSKTSPCYNSFLGHETPFQFSGVLSAFFCPQKSADEAQPSVAQRTQARDPESRIPASWLIQIIQQIRRDLCKPWHWGRTVFSGWRVAGSVSSQQPPDTWENLSCGEYTLWGAGDLWMRGWDSVGNYHVMWDACEWRYYMAGYLGFMHV